VGQWGCVGLPAGRKKAGGRCQPTTLARGKYWGEILVGNIGGEILVGKKQYRWIMQIVHSEKFV